MQLPRQRDHLADFVVTAITPMEIEKKMKSRLNQEISIVLVTKHRINGKNDETKHCNNQLEMLVYLGKPEYFLPTSTRVINTSEQFSIKCRKLLRIGLVSLVFALLLVQKIRAIPSTNQMQN